LSSRRGPSANRHISDQLLEEGQKYDQKKERLRQQLAMDPNCTFKPELSSKSMSKVPSRSSLQRQDHQYGGPQFEGIQYSSAIDVIDDVVDITSQ